MTRDELRAAIDATVVRLVARAAAEHWPIRNDHCFLRIAYDNACGVKWDTVVKPPAWRNLPLDRMATALSILADIEMKGRPALDPRNRASLGWRYSAVLAK